MSSLQERLDALRENKAPSNELSLQDRLNSVKQRNQEEYTIPPEPEATGPTIWEKKQNTQYLNPQPVSYTHLTLPTILRV